MKLQSQFVVGYAIRRAIEYATQNALRTATSSPEWDETRYRIGDTLWRATLNEGWEETR